MRRPFATDSLLVRLRLGVFVAIVSAAQFSCVAQAQDAGAESALPTLTTEPLGMTGWRRDSSDITTEVLGMTGWRPDPVLTITAGTLGMTGWKRDPVTITTWALGMAGWQFDPHVIATPALGMTGWWRDPIAVTTPALRITGWAEAPEECSAPFVRDDAGQACICPQGLLPSGGACISAETAPPHDLRVEIEGPDACTAGAACLFNLFVANIGAGPFRGPLVVSDTVDLAETRISAAGSGWSCAAGACVQPQVTLAPGASARLTVDVRVPAGDGPGVRLRHCAELGAPEPGDAPVRFAQLMLPAAGFDAGPADNQMGQKTRAGIAAFRSTAGLPPGTDIDQPLIAALNDLVTADPRPDNDRSCTTVRFDR